MPARVVPGLSSRGQVSSRAQMTWPELGYAVPYLGSYATFAALRQVEYPTLGRGLGWWSDQMVMAIFPRACPAWRSRVASGTPVSG
jgi:hypothetical protein